MKRLNLLILVLGLISAGCEKKDVKLLDGTYSGTFYYTHPMLSVAPPPSGPASLTINGNQYTSTGNSNRIPAGGSGTFNISSNSTIDFKDTNVWTADFDWGLVLTGKYTYKVKADSLYLTKYYGEFKAYEYRLKKVN